MNADLLLRKEFFNACNPQTINITLSPTQGDDIIITEDRITQGTFAWDRYSLSGSVIEIGSAIASEVSFELDNSDGAYDDVAFEGASMLIQIGVADGNGEYGYGTIGVFTIDEVPKKRDTIHITAYDNMMRFDRVYDEACINWSEGIASATSILTAACDACHVVLETAPTVNMDYMVKRFAADENVTWRTVIQSIAMLSATCAYIDANGHLAFAWYEKTPSARTNNNTITLDDRYASDYNDADITVTGVEYKTSEKIYLAGNEGYVLSLERNPLISDGIETIVGNIWTAINGFSYTPFSAQCVPSPYYDLFDTVYFEDINGNHHRSVVTGVNHILNGSTELKGVGMTETNKGYAASSPLTARQQRVIQSVVEAATAQATAEINRYQQSLVELNQIMANAVGLKQTITDDGKRYLHNNDSLEAATIIYTINSGGFAWASSWNNGNPIWNYGITADGNAIFRQVNAQGINVASPTDSRYQAVIMPSSYGLFYNSQPVLNATDENGVGILKLNRVVLDGYIRIGKARLYGTDDGADIVIVR